MARVTICSSLNFPFCVENKKFQRRMIKNFWEIGRRQGFPLLEESPTGSPGNKIPSGKLTMGRYDFFNEIFYKYPGYCKLYILLTKYCHRFFYSKLSYAMTSYVILFLSDIFQIYLQVILKLFLKVTR